MSGSTIGGVIGGVIGFVWGGGNWQAGWMIGSAIGGYVDPDVIKGPRLDRNQKQLSNEGAPRPLIYGNGAVMGNIIQCGPIVEHKKKERTGKGGPVQETYTYTRTVAIRICEGQVLGGDMKLIRVWMNDKLVYDRTPGATLTADSAKFASILTFYPGSETQLPSPSLEALPAENGGGAGNVPAYRGTCYAVLTDLDCTDFGGAVPQFKWEVSNCGTETEVIGVVWAALSSEALYLSTSPTADGWYESGPTAGLDFVEMWGRRIIMFGISAIQYTDDIDATRTTVTAPWSTHSPTALGRPCKAGSRIYVVAGTTKVYYTDDGADSWSSVDVGFNAAHIATDGVNLLILHDGGTTYHFGPIESLSAYTSPGAFNAISYGNGLWVWNGWQSSDGTTWTSVTVPSPGGDVLECYDNFSTSSGVWLATNRGGSTDNFMARSPDGEEPYVYLTGMPAYRTEAGNYWDTFAEYGGVVVAIASNAESFAPIRSDPSGETWELVSLPPEMSGKPSAKSIAVTDGYIGIQIPDVPGYFYDRATDTVSGPGVGTVDPCVITLDEIVADLTERGNVLHYDVTTLATDVVIGYPITSPTTSAGAIKSLQEVYYFDYPEWGDSGDDTTTLRAVRRGGAAVWSLDDDDLIDADDEETRAQAVEFPRKVNLISLSPTANYNPIKQTAERESENVRAIGETTVDTAVVFERDEAAQRVDILSKVMTEEALGRSEVTVPEDFTRYTTSDPGTWKGKRWRIDKIESGEGESKWFLTRDRAKSYESTALGSTALDPTPAPSSMRGPTMFSALNLPRLRSQDSTPGMYIAVCGIMPAWEGCDLYLSTDGGVTELKVATIINPAVMGVLTDGITDSDEPLSVDLYDGEVSDATDAQLAERMNAAAVTSSGVSEILQFKDADQTDNLADLTTLTRGLLNTTAESHSTGDGFVLLDGSVYFLPLDISLSGKELIFRPVSRGTVPANNVTYTVTFNPLFTGPQVVETITVSGNAITVNGENLWRIIPDA